MPQLAVFAEYHCGHPRRCIVSSQLRVRQDLHSQLTDIVDRIPTREDGRISMTCNKCGRSAATMVIALDGTEISRSSATEIRESGIDATYTKPPTGEMN